MASLCRILIGIYAGISQMIPKEQPMIAMEEPV
jgi:hypothetical protein